MAAGALYPVYVRIPLYLNADDARAKRNVSSYITPTGSEVEGPGKFYINNAVSDSYRPAVAIWFIHDTYGGAGYAIGWINDDQNAAPTVPQATNGTMGLDLKISTPRVNASFKHTLKYNFAGASGTIATGVGTSYTWTPPPTLANRVPNATRDILSIICETYAGSTLVGTKTITVYLYVPVDAEPSISSVALSEAVSAVSNKFPAGTYVQNKSKVKTVVGASGAYGSKISRIAVTVDGVTKTGATTTSNLLRSAGSYTIKIVVTDSRGRTASTTRTITVYAWSAPKITKLSGIRTNASGEAMNDGWNARVYYAFSITTVNNKNANSFVIQWLDGSTWRNLTSGSGYTANTNFLTTALFNPDQSFKIRIRVTDAFTTSVYEFDLPTSSSIMDIRHTKKGLAIGKASELDAVEIAWDTYFTGNVWVNGTHALSTRNKNSVSIADEIIVNVSELQLSARRAGSMVWITFRWKPTKVGFEVSVLNVPSTYAPSRVSAFAVSSAQSQSDIGKVCAYLSAGGTVSVVTKEIPTYYMDFTITYIAN